MRKDTVSEQLISWWWMGWGHPCSATNWLASLPVEWSAIKSMTMVGKEKQLVQRAERLKALLEGSLTPHSRSLEQWQEQGHSYP